MKKLGQLLLLAAISGSSFAETTVETTTNVSGSALEQKPSNEEKSNDSAPELFKKLKSTAHGDIYICSMRAESVLIKLSMGDFQSGSIIENSECVKRSKDRARTNYSAIRAKLKDNKEAMNAVNDYFASLMALFDDLHIRSGENNSRDYANRVEAAMNALKNKEYLVELQLM